MSLFVNILHSVQFFLPGGQDLPTREIPLARPPVKKSLAPLTQRPRTTCSLIAKGHDLLSTLPSDGKHTTKHLTFTDLHMLVKV